MDIYNITSKLGFSAEYVERLSPAERGMYLQYYLREQKEIENKKNKDKGLTIGGPVGE